MTETLVVSILIVGVAMLCLCVKLIFKPDSSFTSMHIHDSGAMRRRGIHCVLDQDCEERALRASGRAGRLRAGWRDEESDYI